MNFLRKIWRWAKRMIGRKRLRAIKRRVAVVRRRWKRSAVRKAIKKRLPAIKKVAKRVVRDVAIVVVTVAAVKVAQKLQELKVISPEQMRAIIAAMDEIANGKVWNVLRRVVDEIPIPIPEAA